MIGARWSKIRGDLQAEKGRALIMVAALAVSLMGIGTVLGAYAILSREVPRNYLGTHPASAAFDISSGVDSRLVEEVRRLPGIEAAEAGDIVIARAKVGMDWIPFLLFVVNDFDGMRINTFAHQSGAWPPPEGTMLIERSALPILNVDQEQAVTMKPPHGVAQPIKISGVVHDPGLAPAWQERTGYGYITPATLAALGEPAALGELRVTMQGSSLDLAAIESRASELARWLAARGHRVEQVRVPPPGRHPHQSQMEGVLFLLLAFSVLSLVLSGVLVATSLAAMLARQVREIGVMKTIGARSLQVAGLYAAFVATLGAVAVIIAVPLGIGGARALSAMTARMLNLTLGSDAAPGWVFVVQASLGVLVPLLVAAVPIVRASTITVRQAMDQHGVAAAPGARWLSSVEPGYMTRTLVLAVRNSLRRPRRLLLTLTLLSAGGAMFISAFNVSRGWERIIDRVYENRSYDVEVRLNARASIADRLRELEGVRRVESWGYTRAALWRPDQVDLVRTYPDGGHGSLSLMAPPADTELVRFPLIAGRWLVPGDTDSVVVNHMILTHAPGISVGDWISLSVAGRSTRWRVVGIVEEVGSPAIAYVSDRAFARALQAGQHMQILRIATTATSSQARLEIVRRLERRLEDERVSVAAVIPLALLRTAMGDHILVLIRLLLAMAGLMMTVGLMGLASTMGTNVLERTRELAVMKTIGATPRQIARLLVSEALVIAFLSWLLAILLAVPLSFLIGSTVGHLAFHVRLPTSNEPTAVVAWLAMALLVGVLATLLPARRASNLTIRDALTAV